ncbi:MAG: 2-phosphosulfolactate phosphatase [Candidatus Micrarchaeota archaeon]|nr:2-phosphosulfolactate phosphatase [Candidatus Micrarchaeota archaeon]
MIEPTSDKARKTEGFTLSPQPFLGNPPKKVTIESPNGAFLSINAKGEKHVVYGSILNAKAVGLWLDQMNMDATLIAAGEVSLERRQLMQDREKELAKDNPIFAEEDLLAAGAIAYFSRMHKEARCKDAENLFIANKNRLLDELKSTASHRFLEERGKGEETVYYGKLNLYGTIPKLHFIGNSPEISSATGTKSTRQ